MSITSHTTIPRPCVDPITSLYEALSVASLAIARPLSASTIVLALDDEHRGVGFFVFHPLSPDIAQRIAKHIRLYPEVNSVVLVSTRCRAPAQKSDQLMHQYMSSLFRSAGFSLHDWAVVGRGGLYCPRSLLNISDPWPSSAINL